MSTPRYWRTSPPSPLDFYGSIALTGGFAGPVRGDGRAVAASCVAEPLGPVFGQVDDDVATAGVLADAQAAQFSATYQVDERHRGLDRHARREWRVGLGGVQVVRLPVVLGELRKGVRLAEESVDDLHDPVLVLVPYPA